MEKRSAIVIGSGIAGMAAAIRLAVAGYKVTVYEKNEQAGGKISAFTKDGIHFDAGPSLFTQPQNFRELFELAGERMEDYLPYEKVEVACRYFYENGKVIDAFTDADKFEEELTIKAGEPAGNVARYLVRADKLYHSIGDVFLNRSLHKRNTWLHPRILKAVKALRPAYIATSLNRYNANQFQSAEARQLFNRYATYNGSDPYRAPAMLSMIPHLEHNEGVFYPKHGMISIARALQSLAEKKGVAFHFGTPVQRIIYHEGKVQGVVVDGQNIMCDTVISNVDAYFTYKNLLHHLPKANKILKSERSSSALIFYWGVTESFPELGLHNIFFSSDYKKEFNAIFKNKGLSADPTVYVNITSVVEKEHAPKDASNWFVMINVPHHNGQDWEQLKIEARKHILSKLSRILKRDIEPLIISEELMDPAKIEEQTACLGGSLYGTSSNTKMAAFFRHPNFSNYAKGLYFCGGTVHPGGGLPLCLKSAAITTDLITHDTKKLKSH